MSNHARGAISLSPTVATTRYSLVDDCEISEAILSQDCSELNCEEKLAVLYREHYHDDDEARLICDGECFFDIRDKADLWIRIHATKGDLLVVS